MYEEAKEFLHEGNEECVHVDVEDGFGEGHNY